MKKTSNEYIAIGLMLFALFFGAGNLIFPAFMGQNSGWNTWYATAGFLITGVGLPFASVLAICFPGKSEGAGRTGEPAVRHSFQLRPVPDHRTLLCHSQNCHGVL